MAITIFYSWQTDSPQTVNRNFIEGALKAALKKISREYVVENSPRDGKLALDKDTKGLPGTPPIVQAIFDKIDQCAVFIPDLTFVARTDKQRPVPNANVLIEYGWALKSVGYARIVPVMNTAFGEPTEKSLPFNMRHMRWPLRYHLMEDTRGDKRKKAKEGLVADLSEAILTVIKSEPGEEDAVIARQAAMGPAIETIRARQPELSEANKVLSGFVREHGSQFAQVFKNNSEVQSKYAGPRQACKNVFLLATAYVDAGIITNDEITKIIASSSADIFLGVVERMEKIINKDYRQRPFEIVAEAFNKQRFPPSVQLIGASIPVDDPTW